MADRKTRTRKEKRTVRKAARKVFLDPSSPSVSSIVRVVCVSLLILLFAALIFTAFYLLSFLLFLAIISVFFAYLLEPLVSFIRRPFVVRNLEHLMPRAVSILISYVLVFGVFGVAIAYLAPLIARQIREFAQNLPNYAGLIQARIQSLNNRYEQLMISEELQKQINERIATLLGDYGSQFTAIAGNTVFDVVTYLPWLLLVPVLAFFFLKDAAVFREMFLRFFPSGSWRARAESFVNDVNSTLAAYTHAQLVSCFLIGVLCTLAFTFIGLDYSLLLGILAGVLEFIPLLGPLTVGIIATLVGAFSDNPWQAFWVALFLIILRLTHDYVTYPRIVREGIHLHPLAVILSVLAGEQIAGIAGVFLSIPLVALITVLYKHYLEHRGRKGPFAGLWALDQTSPPNRSEADIETDLDASVEN